MVENVNNYLEFYQSDRLASGYENGATAVSDEITDETKAWATVYLGEGTVDEYDGNGSFSDYLLSYEGQSCIARMEARQSEIIAAIAKLGIEVTYEYSYTTLVNGFSAYLSYKDMDAVAAIDGVLGVYEALNYEVCSTDTVGSASMAFQNTGIFANDSEYMGDGMTVAVIDSGVEYTHEAFSVMPTNGAMNLDEVEKVLQLTNAYKNYKGSGGGIGGIGIIGGGATKLKSSQLYYNEKVPYKFDYADLDDNANPSALTHVSIASHGTHVAGIITGNSDVITGVVPNAQLFVMKVIADSASGAAFTNICAAFEDCAVMGVDVVNLSMGSVSGFTRSYSSTAAYENSVMEKLEKFGITVCTSSGNLNNSSHIVNEEGTGYNNLNWTSNPDNGIVTLLLPIPLQCR